MRIPELDAIGLEQLLEPEERMVRDEVRRFVDAEVMPHVAQHARAGRFDDTLFEKMGALGLLGATVADAHHSPMAPLAYWLALAELERADSGLRSAASVQGALCMFPIASFGSPAQHERYLPGLRSGRLVGCFGLTEPDAGSDPASMQTRARSVDGGYVLHGAKRWITNGSRADVAVVFAKTGDDAASIRAFLVDKGTPGFSQMAITDKLSFRFSDTAELVFDDCFVPASHMLPKAQGLGAALKCLAEARAGIAMGVLGAAENCLETTLNYAKSRIAFGHPIANTQLVQAKFARMVTSLSTATLLSVHLARQKRAGVLTPVQISMAKMNNVAVALDIARTCRDIMGANGITDAYPVMRHLVNLETVFTYEGTHDIHQLVVGQHVCGAPAFRMG